MRNFCAAVLAVALVSSSALAASDNVGAIAPGKPAGLKEAQGNGNATLWMLGGGAILVTLGLGLTTGGGGSGGGGSQNAGVTSSTSTK